VAMKSLKVHACRRCRMVMNMHDACTRPWVPDKLVQTLETTILYSIICILVTDSDTMEQLSSPINLFLQYCLLNLNPKERYCCK
jgi:hypothetical protein